MDNGYESDGTGCSSLSEDTIVLASAVAAAFALMSIVYTCANVDSNQAQCVAERIAGRCLVGLGTGSEAGQKALRV
jgi:hypothetical protein